jgi:hypothetical protein
MVKFGPRSRLSNASSHHCCGLLRKEEFLHRHLMPSLPITWAPKCLFWRARSMRRWITAHRLLSHICTRTVFCMSTKIITHSETWSLLALRPCSSATFLETGMDGQPFRQALEARQNSSGTESEEFCSSGHFVRRHASITSCSQLIRRVGPCSRSQRSTCVTHSAIAVSRRGSFLPTLDRLELSYRGRVLSVPYFLRRGSGPAILFIHGLGGAKGQ